MYYEYSARDFDIDELFEALVESYQSGLSAIDLQENLMAFLATEGKEGLEMVLQFAFTEGASDMLDALQAQGINVVPTLEQLQGWGVDPADVLIASLGETRRDVYDALVREGVTAPRESIMRAAQMAAQRSNDTAWVADVYRQLGAGPEDVVRLMIALDQWAAAMGTPFRHHRQLLDMVNARVGVDADAHARILRTIPMQDRIGYGRRYTSSLTRPDYGRLSSIPVQRG